MALLQRHDQTPSQVPLHVLHSLKRHEVQGIVRTNAIKGAALHTDSFSSYTGLIGDFAHTRSSTTPSATWMAKSTPTTAKTFWKRAIKGTYVSVEPFHLFRYRDEQAFRVNTAS